MRIVSVQLAPVARIFAFVYAIFGLASFLQYAFTSARTLVLPVGILMGIFHLNLNFDLSRSSNMIANALMCTGAVLSYALTGWMTGVVFTLCFNLLAKKMGGIDAKFVSVEKQNTSIPA
jgi:hypothetical protein